MANMAREAWRHISGRYLEGGGGGGKEEEAVVSR